LLDGAANPAEPDNQPTANQPNLYVVKPGQSPEFVATIESGAKGWPAAVRSRFVGELPLEGPVNAFLLCRDQILALMDEKDARVTLALFLAEPQAQVGTELRLSQSAVSNRQRRRGGSTLVRAHESFGARRQAEE